MKGRMEVKEGRKEGGKERNEGRKYEKECVNEIQY